MFDISKLGGAWKYFIIILAERAAFKLNSFNNFFVRSFCNVV